MHTFTNAHTHPPTPTLIHTPTYIGLTGTHAVGLVRTPSTSIGLMPCLLRSTALRYSLYTVSHTRGTATMDVGRTRRRSSNSAEASRSYRGSLTRSNTYHNIKYAVMDIQSHVHTMRTIAQQEKAHEDKIDAGNHNHTHTNGDARHRVRSWRRSVGRGSRCRAGSAPAARSYTRSSCDRLNE